MFEGGTDVKASPDALGVMQTLPVRSRASRWGVAAARAGEVWFDVGQPDHVGSPEQKQASHCASRSDICAFTNTPDSLTVAHSVRHAADIG